MEKAIKIIGLIFTKKAGLIVLVFLVGTGAGNFISGVFQTSVQHQVTQDTAINKLIKRVDSHDKAINRIEMYLKDIKETADSSLIYSKKAYKKTEQVSNVVTNVLPYVVRNTEDLKNYYKLLLSPINYRDTVKKKNYENQLYWTLYTCYQ